jgi:ribosomal protein S14
MIIKLRQQLKTHKEMPATRVTNFRSLNFMLYFVRRLRAKKPSQGARATVGFIQWLKAVKVRKKVDESPRAECFITGRSRGTSRRFTVARTKLKELAGQAKLFGVQKSSW